MKRMKQTLRMTREGYHEPVRMGLTKVENWTPLLVYIHVSRMIVGFILGFLLGISLIFWLFVKIPLV